MCPGFGQLQSLKSRLNGIDPELAGECVIYHSTISTVGLDDRDILVEVVTDLQKDIILIASALEGLSFADGPIPRIHIQHIPLAGTLVKMGLPR